MSRSRSRGPAGAQPAAARQLAFGAIAANAMLFPRVLIATAALNTPLVPVLAPYFLVPALVAAAVAAFGARSALAIESDADARG